MSFVHYESFWWFAACALATWLLAHGYCWVAQKVRILAHPNERSAATHKVPTPTGGGLSFLLVFAAGLLILWGQSVISLQALLAWLGPLAVGGIGFIDDLRPLPVQVRTPVYLAVAGWCIYQVGFPVINVAGYSLETGMAGVVFGLVSLMWLQNLYNFMDGIDGLAITEAAFVCAAVLLIGGDVHWLEWNATLIMLCGVCVGFAVINWPRAKVFMGDAGAGFLGLSLGMLSLAYAPVSVWTWMILLAYFITDACLTVSIRLVRGERIYESHSMHAYQHLTRRFGGTPVLLGILIVDAAWLYPIAVLSHRYPDSGVFLLLLASTPLLVCQYLCGAGQQQPRLNLVRL